MNTVIKIENLSKIYRLGQIGTKTLSLDLERWWITKVMKKEDPFLKIGESNVREEKGQSDIVYSLRDINLEIQQGEAVGIIGKNGAGKSTLLKILSRVTSPTTGIVKVKGRVASLLEIGTGFHPELTGRENIYLNGAILGMRKKEIDKKFDEIVDFSGVERYIDTPVKRYSSGMYVRLAFAVAAHLESEILIVDEVLAVGDAEFQSKCLGKMEEVSKGQGRTVIFVSHNMESIIKLCSRSMLLIDGKNNKIGNSNDVVDIYIKNNYNLSKVTDISKRIDRKGSGNIQFTDTWIENIRKEKTDTVKTGDYIKIVATFSSKNNFNLKNLAFAFAVNTIKNISLTDLSSNTTGTIFENKLAANGIVECIIPKIPYNIGTYYYNLYISQNGIMEDWITHANYFKVIGGDFFNSGKLSDSSRLMFTEHIWKITNPKSVTDIAN